MVKVFINGSSGTTGLRLRERLDGRAGVELLEIDERLRRSPDEIRKYMAESDVTFLCLPDAAAIEAVKLAEGLACRIIDASTAHRTQRGWEYGFPELCKGGLRGKIVEAVRVAVPGCHATGYISLVRPLADAKLIPHGYTPACMSLTGYSGGGKAMIADYSSTDRDVLLKSPMQYALSQRHKHLSEMKHYTGGGYPVFMPVVGDFYSGMLVTVPLPEGLSAGDAREIYRGYYAGAELVSVPDGEPEALYAGAMSGRDDLTIYVTGSEGRILAHALFDNLGKGASGAALQCLNLMTGADETESLITS